LVLQSSLLLSRFSQEHVNLVAHLDGTNLKCNNDYSFYKGFIKRFTANEAMKKAYQAIDYSVMKQSTVLSIWIFFHI
jgi:DHA2 family multidrug resistance protein